MVVKQLSLFKGRRQRGITPQPAKEFATHTALADLLRRWTQPAWKWTHIPLGEYRDDITAARLKRMGVTAGWPDFMFVGPGRLLFVELKRGGQQLSDAQEDIAAHIKACGFEHFVTDSLAEAVTFLRDAGVVRARVSA